MLTVGLLGPPTFLFAGDSDADPPWNGLWQGQVWEHPGTTAAANDQTTDDNEPPRNEQVQVEGWLDIRHRYRTTDSGLDTFHDQDVYTSLYFSAGEEELWRFELDGSVVTDIDGLRPGAFASVHDAYHRGRPYLYRAFLEGLHLGPFKAVRLGRQLHDPGTESYRFDGLSVETLQWNGAAIHLFGGLGAHLYERALGRDWLVGSDLKLSFGSATSLRLGYIHFDDYRKHDWEFRDNRFEQKVIDDFDVATLFLNPEWSLGPRMVSTPFRDDRFDATFIQKFGVYGGLRLDAATLGGRATEVRGLALLQFPEAGFKSRVGFLGRFGSWREFTTQNSYYDEILVRYEDFAQVDLSASQLLVPQLAIEAGGTVRELVRGGLEGPFNHSFSRVRAGLSVLDWPIPDLIVSGYGVFWHSRSTGDAIASWGAEASYRVEDRFRIAVGSDFSLYRVNRFLLDERTHVRNIFAKLRWRPLDHVELRLGVDFEKDEEDFYFQTDAGFRLFF